MDKANSNHIAYIDTLKGFAMFLVVMGHVIAWSFNSYGAGFNVPAAKETPSVLLWWNTIYSFHMPLLFWVSGFLFLSPGRKFTLDMLPGYLWRKTYTLLVPFVVAGLVFMAITAEPFTQYWFLRTLFFFLLLSLPYELLRYKFLNYRPKSALCIDIVYYFLAVQAIKTISWKFRGDNIFDMVFDMEHLLHYQYFVFGIFCNRYLRLRQLIDKNWCYTVSLLIFSCAMVVLNTPGTMRWPAYLAHLLSPFAGIVCAYYLFKNTFTAGKIVGWLQHLGRHSLEIYILHFYFVLSIPKVGMLVIDYMQDSSFHQSMGSTFQLLYGIAGATIICILSMLAAKVLRTSNLISMVFMGRKNK